MKSRKPIIIAPIVLLLLIVVNIIVLAELHPYRPGNTLFGLQRAIENTQVKLISNPEKKVHFCFKLVERRLKDLELVNRSDQVQPAVDAFEDAITTAILNIQYINRADAQVYYHNIEPLMRRVETVTTSLEMRLPSAHLSSLQQKVSTLRSTNSPIELIKLIQEEYLSKILFVQEVSHHTTEFVVVENKTFVKRSMSEDDQNCMDCHADGQYMDAATECSKCHIPDVYFASKLGKDEYRPKYLEESYPYHFGGDCIDCHKTKSWEPFQFDHRNVYTCVSCHEEDYPQKELLASSDQVFMMSLAKKEMNTMKSPHFPGDCVTCHTDTTDWRVTDYDHQLGTCEGCHHQVERISKFSSTILECTKETNCQACHTFDGHSGEFGNACANCHQNVLDWQDVSINHAGFATCLACHANDKPSPTHFQGDCSQCHTTSAWRDVTMNHGPQGDCQSCHQPPANHQEQGFTAQCSTCHNTTTWSNAVFNHTLSNCSTCHTSPDDHYPATCTSCHFTNAWNIISVNHSTLIVCTNCHTAPSNHYVGLCSGCHSTTSWSDVTFNHTGYTDCKTCHTTPSGHYPGECTLCHKTTSWGDVTFNHTGYTNCSTCHASPTNHYPGECTLCHKTTSWGDVTFNHTGYTNCSTCHTSPTNHYPGECTLCHKTTSWGDVTFNHSRLHQLQHLSC